MLTNIAFSWLLSNFFRSIHNSQFIARTGLHSPCSSLFIGELQVTDNVFCPLSKFISHSWWSWPSRLSKLLSSGLKSDLPFFRVAVLGTSGCNTCKMIPAAVAQILMLVYSIIACLKGSHMEHSGCSLLCEWPFTNIPKSWWCCNFLPLVIVLLKEEGLQTSPKHCCKLCRRVSTLEPTLLFCHPTQNNVVVGCSEFDRGLALQEKRLYALSSCFQHQQWTLMLCLSLRFLLIFQKHNLTHVKRNRDFFG